MRPRQSQSGGNNSTQIQALGDVVVGVDESRAREIAEQAAKSVMTEYAEESIRLIQDRIAKLDDQVIASLVRKGKLEVFADPGFQRSYTKAQSGAAVSEKESDYQLLAGLLIDRAERGTARNVRAGIERSIEIVDQIDEEALRGLTVLQALGQYAPMSPYLEDGLDLMESLFSDLVDGPLPEGGEWLDHLDILDAARLTQGVSFKPFREFYPALMPGYLAEGAPIGSSEPPFVIDGHPLFGPNLLVEHELKPGHHRFAASTIETLEYTLPAMAHIHSELVEQAKKRLGFKSVSPELVDPFLERLRSRPTLAKIEIWWEQIPQFAQVTGVGKVLARSNALRLDVRKILPPIN